MALAVLGLLVSKRVTNWTLSDRTRRIDLPVGVDYGSAPDKVVEVLEAVARAHPQIMQAPAPQAVFKAFDDSSIRFELRAWTNRFERWPRSRPSWPRRSTRHCTRPGCHSPSPQREVRLLRDAPADPWSRPPVLPTPRSPRTAPQGRFASSTRIWRSEDALRGTF